MIIYFHALQLCVTNLCTKGCHRNPLPWWNLFVRRNDVCFVLFVFLQGDLVAAGILSGNRNFEGRIHPLTRANYLASPPLVVAYAIAGTTLIDFEKEPLGKYLFQLVFPHSQGPRRQFLSGRSKKIWPRQTCIRGDCSVIYHAFSRYHMYSGSL